MSKIKVIAGGGMTVDGSLSSYLISTDRAKSQLRDIAYML